MVDGTTVTMPDTPLNQAKYPQHQQREGCGFPIMKLVGLFCLDSGAWIATAKSHFKVHESRHFARLLRYLRPGDTLVTDRGFCSYWAAATLMARDMHFVMRNHQKRSVDFRRGKRLGKGDHCIKWSKPRQRPSWINEQQYEALPDHLMVRETRLPAPQRKGFRTTTITVVSSFLVAGEKTVAELADDFMRRWKVELYFDDIKTSQAMDVLRTKSPELICRELLMHSKRLKIGRLFSGRIFGKVAGVIKNEIFMPRATRFGRVQDARFVEVEFDAPVGTRLVIEVEGGLRLLVADDEAVEMAARLLNALGAKSRDSTPNATSPR